jgi:DNA-binding transcriptional MocR family regulator
MMPWIFMDSPAWLSLTPAQRSVFFQMCRWHNGFNNGQIGYSVRRASEECNISKGTAAKAFKELQSKGFIALEKEGSFSYKLRHAAEWRLTTCPTETGPATKDFMRWTPPTEAATNRQAST